MFVKEIHTPVSVGQLIFHQNGLITRVLNGIYVFFSLSSKNSPSFPINVVCVCDVFRREFLIEKIKRVLIGFLPKQLALFTFLLFGNIELETLFMFLLLSRVYYKFKIPNMFSRINKILTH
jgi:hypothetical protein